MTIGGQTFTVSQAGTPPCAFTISPTSSNLGSSAAATGTVAVTTGASCGWTATSNASWLTISNGASGNRQRLRDLQRRRQYEYDEPPAPAR